MHGKRLRLGYVNLQILCYDEVHDRVMVGEYENGKLVRRDWRQLQYSREHQSFQFRWQGEHYTTGQFS